MPIDDELYIARKKKEAVLDTSPAPAAVPTERQEGFVEKTARRMAQTKTRNADQKLQDRYRAKKGLDEFNRPLKRMATSRSSGR